MELIGILVFENGKKIDAALENVERANRDIGKALDKIEVAKFRTNRSTNRKCCIIILALIAIALIVTIYFVVWSIFHIIYIVQNMKILFMIDQEKYKYR